MVRNKHTSAIIRLPLEHMLQANTQWSLVRLNVEGAAMMEKDKSKKLTQKERLDILLDYMKEDSVQYKDLDVPEDDTEKRGVFVLL